MPTRTLAAVEREVTLGIVWVAFDLSAGYPMRVQPLQPESVNALAVAGI
jgi:hypothetical protein